MNLKEIPQQLKLYILLFVVLLMTVFFLVVYTKDYFNYYYELYTYRQQLIERLTTQEVKKPQLQESDPYRGNPRSRIVIFEYGDFSCEGCKMMQPVLQQVIDFYGERNVFIVWKDLPTSVNTLSLSAHNAAHCAHDQNAFFEYKDLLFANQTSYSQSLFLELGRTLNLDMNVFEACVKNKDHELALLQKMREALEMGVTGTPTLFINNVEVASGFNIENIRSIIEKTQ